MSQKHQFSKEETSLGVRNSRLSRRAELKLEKTLAKLHLESEAIQKILDLAKVVIAQPGGTFLVGWLLIDGLERIGYLGSTQSTPGEIQRVTTSSSTPAWAKGALSYIDSFLKGAESIPGIGAIANTLTGGSLTTLTGSPSPASQDAAFLKTSLFAICMTQALGGGQGIATLGTAALAALK